MENTPFDEHMAGTTDAEIAEWYGEKYGKDYITDTKTMTTAQIDDIKTQFKTDVAQSFVDDTDEVALSAREWLNENTSRGVDPTAQIDDTLTALADSDEVIQVNKDFDLEKFIADIPEDIPNVPKQSLKKALSSRLKKTLVGGIDALDMYELGLIGMALVEPAVQKALQPIMPMIIPGFKGELDSKTYGQQVIENLQTTAKISPTAKVAKKFAEIPEQGEYNSYSWVGKMLDR